MGVFFSCFYVRCGLSYIYFSIIIINELRIFTQGYQQQDNLNQMNAFKKKNAVSQPAPTTEQLTNRLNLLLGLGSTQTSSQSKPATLNKQLILSCAMFWDSKKRIDRIKSLMLKQQGLQQFNNTEDFQISQLTSIQLLSLSKNNITHLQPLAVLDTLICLNINSNKIYNIEPLKHLPKLQQLYASNNQIVHIDPLSDLKKLRIVNLYGNKISHLENTVKTLGMLSLLEEVDIEENPVYREFGEDCRRRVLAFGSILRFNGELVLQEDREQLGIMTQSVVIMPTAKFRDTHTSFFNSNKSQSKTSRTETETGSTSQSYKPKTKSKSQLASIVQDLERRYLGIDDKFQQQIVKNVQLKSQYQRTVEHKKQLLRKTEDIKDKEEELTLLKRKVKMLKQNLFNNPQSQKKGDLLRELFQLEMMGESNKGKTNTIKQSQKDEIKQNAKEQLWIRKFDFDQEIFIGSNPDDQYLLDQDQQIAMLLNSNNSALQQLKRELREMTQ